MRLHTEGSKSIAFSMANSSGMAAIKETRGVHSMMTLPRFLRVFSPSLIIVLGFACAVVGQTETATVSGLVTDRTGAAVAGAEVRLQMVDRGTVTTTTTNNAGIYVFPSVNPGQYQISVQKQGFKQVDLLGLIVNVQDHIEQNFRLEVGSIAESVTVEAGASMINTTSAAVSTVVDQTYVKNIPLNGRSFQDLILLTPGVVTQSPQNSGALILGRTGEFSVNGQRSESNYYTVDGVSANVGASQAGTMPGGAGPSGSVPAATALGTTQALVSVDDLQEFRVQSSSYSAEYGRNPGGQFAFETKSDANQWHGTAYDYLRNGFFDAQDWFNNYFGIKQPAIRQNDFGGTLGGPVGVPGLYNGKDKTFFFVSYEGLRLTSPQAASLNSTSVRFDHLLNEKLRLFFRFSNTGSNARTRETFANGLTPVNDDVSAYTIRTYTAGATSMFSSRLSNEFRVNYSSNEVASRTVIDALGGSTPVDLVQLVGLPAGSAVSVYLCYDGCFPLQQSQAFTAQRQWNLVDTLSVSLGRHQLKFGVDYRRLAPSAAQPSPIVQYLYTSQADVQTNSLSSAFLDAHAPIYPLYANFSAFAQDEWRMSQRLSLSLGLRWEMNPAPSVTRGFTPYAIQGSAPNAFTLAPQGTPLWRTTWYNFAPRFGVAYLLRNAPGSETVVRGGFGIFYDTGQQLGSLGFFGPGFNLSGVPPVAFPGSIVVPTIVNPPVAPFGRVFAIDSRLQLPYTVQWNASIEQALGKSQALSLSYVGSHARRLLKETQISAPSNPNARTFLLVQNGLTSDYDSLQVQFRRRLSRGLTALASYTWSHCLDYGSQNYSFGFQRGSCNSDVRSNLSSAFSYDLPNVGHNGLVSAVLHHWGLDDSFIARTAFPVPLNGRTLFQPDGTAYSAGLNLVSGQPVYLYGANCDSVLQGLHKLAPGQGCPGGRAINPQAFTNVSSGFGNAPRNFARGFGTWQMNLSIRRDFPVYERLKLQFRADAFNIFNHPNFGAINPSFASSTFGQASGTLASSLGGILNPLYQSGGPRSMQFALKLIF